MKGREDEIQVKCHGEQLKERYCCIKGDWGKPQFVYCYR